MRKQQRKRRESDGSDVGKKKTVGITISATLPKPPDTGTNQRQTGQGMKIGTDHLAATRS